MNVHSSARGNYINYRLTTDEDEGDLAKGPTTEPWGESGQGIRIRSNSPLRLGPFGVGSMGVWFCLLLPVLI